MCCGINELEMNVWSPVLVYKLHFSPTIIKIALRPMCIFSFIVHASTKTFFYKFLGKLGNN